MRRIVNYNSYLCTQNQNIPIMTRSLFSVLLAAFFFGTLCLMAQDFDPNQGYRLEIGDGLALDNQNGTITFSPVNKKAQTQVWRIVKSDRQGY